MELSKVLLTNYLPYAKSTILARALPSIDGLKPVQKRILYTMKGLRLFDGNTAKSQRVNGQTMVLHPNGDSSIYEALALMTTGYNGLNEPYIRSKGGFGAVYSRDLQVSAPRYTEVRLADIATELFDGIDDGAVDFVDNYDATTKEPTLLPVKFPTILVNATDGVAVGTSSHIPSFSLTNSCRAVQGVIQGTITNTDELADVLGVPEFSTGGYLHANHESLKKLCETGKGTFVLSGTVEVYSGKIVIRELPYNTTAEDFMDCVDENMKEGKLKGVRDVQDKIGLHGLKLEVLIKSGYNSRDVLKELCRLTPLRTKISYRTRLILNDRPREVGLDTLINSWIDFRQNCIRRVYENKCNKCAEKIHVLEAWEKIGSKKEVIKELVDIISSNKLNDAKTIIMSRFSLDDIQAEYILDIRLRSLTSDKALKSIEELNELREELNGYKKIANNEDARKKVIVDELEEIIKKYGKDNKTNQAAELTEEDTKVPEVKLSNESVAVIMTQAGYIKKLTSTRDMLEKYVSANGDAEVVRWSIRNNEYLLVFDRFGSVHKILVDDIDSSRGKCTETLFSKAGLEKAEDVIWADACGDYSGSFNLIYPNGKGVRVNYADAKPDGKRTTYRLGYSEVKPKQYWVTREDKFFLVTHRMKAAYCDLTMLGVVSNRTAFKVARLSSGDWFERLIYYKDVPNPKFIDLDKYNKDYTVSIGNDVLWVDEEVIQRAKKQQEEYLAKFKQAESTEEENEEENSETSGNEENNKENTEE